MASVSPGVPGAPGVSRRDALRLAPVLGAAALCAGPAGCSLGRGSSAPATTTPTVAAAIPDGVITAGLSEAVGGHGYDPMRTTGALALAANWHTMEGLTELHPEDRQVYAALGDDLPSAIDDTTYEVTLRKGAVFSNGSPVTVEDVLFSFQRVLDPANGSVYTKFLDFLEAVTIKDETTITVTTKIPYMLVSERLSVVKIVPREVVEADPEGFDSMPVGSGPYRMTDNGAQSQTVVFERNDHYNGPLPALAKSMTWQVLPDATARANAIVSGTVQVINAAPLADLPTMANPVTVAREQAFAPVFAMFNCSTLSDTRARQAIMYALDYEEICTTGMAGLATPATCYVQEGHPAYRKAATVYGYDPARAASLLAEAGITAIRAMCTDHTLLAGVRPIIKKNLEALGVPVTFTERQAAAAYEAIDSGQEVVDVLFAPEDPSIFGADADLLLRWFYSSDLWADTRVRWKGSESYLAVQAALDEAVGLTGGPRLTAWRRAFDIIAEQVPLYPLFHRITPTAYDASTLPGFKPIALPGLSFVDVGSAKA
ncbi:MAG: ABC transporter substrate-binding protein [Actinomyces sp.]|uniref:ABC transporter substrate-binding protein n=1 Tax=Actinomyces sp. TaxID=29317 RepID=UPI0026DD08C0|nr:ABC transporter substrate-binding protein [Actinomyces sp.]MDO4243393.1 ABC transporter substrate-binding protein [Actinomyces sp.]